MSEWLSPSTRAVVRLAERDPDGYTAVTVSKNGVPAARTTGRLALAEVFPHQRAMFFSEPGGRFTIASSRLPDEHLRAATGRFGAAQSDCLLGAQKCPR